MIKEQEALRSLAEACRKHCLSPSTSYNLKAMYGGLELSNARCLRLLEEESNRLKLLAESVLANAIPKYLVDV